MGKIYFWEKLALQLPCPLGQGNEQKLYMGFSPITLMG